MLLLVSSTKSPQENKKKKNTISYLCFRITEHQTPLKTVEVFYSFLANVCRLSQKTYPIQARWINSTFISWPSQTMATFNFTRKQRFFWVTKMEWCSYKPTNPSTHPGRVVGRTKLSLVYRSLYSLYQLFVWSVYDEEYRNWVRVFTTWKKIQASSRHP